MEGAIAERLYLPIGILTATFAGSVFYELISFETISVYYNIAEGDNVYRWWSFTLYVSFLFGLLPAFLLKMFARKSFIVGGLLLTAAHILAAVMITYAGNKQAIMNNSSLMTFLIAVLGGQGASLIFIALLQTVMSAMAVVCTHFVASLIISYFFGSVVFFTCLANGLLGTWSLWFIIIFGAIMFIVASTHLPEVEEEDSGVLGAAAAMTKGILNKRTAGGHLLIQLILSILLVLVYSYDWEYSTGVAIVLGVFWLLNLAVPLLLLALLDEDAIKEMVGSPSEVEQMLMVNKGRDGEQGTADFWMFALVAAFSTGIAFTSLEQAGPLALRNSSQTYDMVQLQQVCTVAGATLSGFMLLYGRGSLSPAAMFQFATFYSIIAVVHMWYLEGRRDQYVIQMGIFIFNGLALGTNLVSMASFCFEEYGKSGFAYTFGVMMTFAAIGFVIADEVIFQWTFDSYAGRQKEDGWRRLYFGNWSEAVAFYYLVIECVLFIVGICAHRSWSARQDEGGAMAAVSDAANLAKNAIPGL